MTGGPWLGGLQVRRTEKGQTPVVDLLCVRCLFHRRVTGRGLVADFLNSDPIEQHRATCTTTPKGTTS